MIFTLSLGIVLLSCVCVASIAVKAYACIPPSLVVTLRHLFDFLFALTEASCRLICIVVLFLYNVVTNVLGSVFCVIPFVYKVASFLVSFLLWVTVHLARGLLGLEEKALNTLSWLFAACVLFLYLENKYQHVRPSLFPWRHTEELPDRQNVEIHAVQNVNNYINNNNNHQNNNDVLENGTVADVEQLEENQQLEIENRENENEENALEEADRNRVNNDNVRNDQREMIRVDQIDRLRVPDPLPVPPARVDDSSDDELDPILCSVCITRRRNVALFPCGHTQLCRECAQIIIGANRPCPVCQTAIEECRRVYV